MSEEYEIILDNALKEWRKASENQDLNAYNNAASYFLLGIKKAREPMPRAHALLAMAYYETASCWAQTGRRDSEKQAEKFSKLANEQVSIALQHEPLEYRAQLVKTWIAGDNVRYMQGGISNLIPRSRGLVDAIFETGFRAAGAGIAATRVEASKAKFRSELTSLLSIYKKIFSEYKIDAPEFVFFSDNLISIADFCVNNKLFDVQQIYSSILNVSPDNDLSYEDLDEGEVEEVKQEVVRVRALAEGRSMMR